MTHIAVNGLKLLFFIFVIVVFNSCSGIRKISRAGRTISAFEGTYINDSLKFSYRFQGDFERIQKRRVLRQSMKADKLRFNAKFCIAFYKTIIPIVVDQYLLYFPNETIAAKQLSRMRHVKLEDYYPQNEIDSTAHTAMKIIHADDKGLIAIIGKNTKEDKYDFERLKMNFSDWIFHTIVTGMNYNNYKTDPPGEIAVHVLYNEDSSINYLLPILALKDKVGNYVSLADKNMYSQTLLTYLSFVSNNARELSENIAKWHNISGRRRKKKTGIKELVSGESALNFIIDKCKKEKIVMFNENHFTLQNRLLLRMILKDMYLAGFRYLALESVSENDKTLNARGFVNAHSGFYTREPNMANLIQEAIALGFHVFGYEADDPSTDREKKQALNLYNNTYKVDSAAKVIVLAGIGHIDERCDADKRWMAAEFKKLAGIDPLTIDQIQFQNDSRKTLCVIDTLKTKRGRYMQTDLCLVNNITYDFAARKMNYSDYKILLDDTAKNTLLRKLKAINFTTKSINSNSIIISVFRKGDYEKDSTATPTLNYIMKSKRIDDITLKLPEGNYIFFIKNKYFTTIAKGRLAPKTQLH